MKENKKNGLDTFIYRDGRQHAEIESGKEGKNRRCRAC